MTEPTREQLLHLADRARRGVLLPDEGALLADAVTELETENAALRDGLAHCRHKPRVTELSAAIERVRALHRKASHGDTCVYCAHGQRLGYDTTWPCDTIRALDQAQQPPTTEAP
ncbi:hypothetical protein ACFV6Z_15485 [Streptomyces sp. NPDC059818]|uniref:hypothetical protein n=1 Tax=Streptomyces sp. NPDC059818 TaxID=3346962 RepID=UPI0036494235